MRSLEVEIKEILNVLPQSYVDWGTKLIGADKAWLRYRGKGIKIGIIDTGLDYQHPDLSSNVKECRSFIDATDGFDSGFHGTHVAGIAAGCNNGVGVIGVAPEAEIYSAKIFAANNVTTTEAQYAAYKWMIEQGVDVINMSYGGLYALDIPGVADFLEEYHRRIKEMADAGIILVAAAGNSGNVNDTQDRISWPARFPEVLAVGAICQESQRAAFSSTGGLLDFAMPGVDVYSCYPGGQWARFSGTSMASPYLAGCVALLQEHAIAKKGRKLTFAEVKQELVKLSTDLGIEGVDAETGYGVVNIGKIGTAMADKTIVRLDQPMVLDKNTWRTLAPLRFIVEVNGGKIVSWDTPSLTVVFDTPGGKRVTMQVDNPEVIVEDLG